MVAVCRCFGSLTRWGWCRCLYLVDQQHVCWDFAQVDLADWLDLFASGHDLEDRPDFVEVQAHFRSLGSDSQQQECAADHWHSRARSLRSSSVQ